MTDAAEGSDKSFSNEVAGNTTPGRLARSSTLAKLKALFQHQFDNEIITCVAASFGWNETRSIKALQMLAGNHSDAKMESGTEPSLHTQNESPMSGSEEIKPSSSSGSTQEARQNMSGEMKAGSEDTFVVKEFARANIDTEMGVGACSKVSVKTNPPDIVDTYSQMKSETEPCGAVGSEIKSGTDAKGNIKYEKQNCAKCSSQIVAGYGDTPKDEQKKFIAAYSEGEESKNSNMDNSVMCKLEADTVANGNSSALSCMSEECPQKKNCISENVSQAECSKSDCDCEAENYVEYANGGKKPVPESTETENSLDNSRQLNISGVFTSIENTHSVSNTREISSVIGGEVQANTKETTCAPFDICASGARNAQPSRSSGVSTSAQSGPLPLSNNLLDGITGAAPPATAVCDRDVICGEGSVSNGNRAGTSSEFVTVPFTHKDAPDNREFDLENIDTNRGKVSEYAWSPSGVRVEDKDTEDKVFGWLRNTEQSYSVGTVTACRPVPMGENSGAGLRSRKVTDQSSSDVTESSVTSLSSSNSSKEVREHNGVRKHTRCTKVDRLANSIIDGKKIMILMRGLPGSGKSTLARHLVRSTMGEEHHRFIHSTDNFFTVCGKGRYKFNPKFLHEAHTWNVKRVLADAVKGVTPIIVDNTNLEASEMRPYATVAVRHGYRIEFLEPNTYWRYFVAECARRNTHGVSIQRVADMMRRFDRSITVAGLLGMYHLQPDASDLIQPRVVTTRMPKHRRKKRKRNRLKRKIRKSLSEEKLMDGESILNLSKILDTLSCGTSSDSNCAVFSNVLGEATNCSSKDLGETESNLLQNSKSKLSCGTSSDSNCAVFSNVLDEATNCSSKDLGETESNLLQNSKSKLCDSSSNSASPGMYIVDGIRSLEHVVDRGEGIEIEGGRLVEMIRDSSHSGLTVRKVVDEVLNDEIRRECSGSPDEYVLVKDSEFIFKKTHDIQKWMSERPSQTASENNYSVSNTLPSPVNVESADTESSKTLENDNIQLNFNFDRQVNRLMEAMDREETAELQSMGNGKSVRTQCEKTEYVIGSECKGPSVDIMFPVPQRSDVGSEFELTEKYKQNASENDSKLGTGVNEDLVKKSDEGNYKMWKCGEKLESDVQHTETTTVNDQTTANTENNYVLWDLEHGNVWGGEDPEPTVNVRVEEDLSLPKPPRVSRKKLPVKDFLKESLHNLSQNVIRPVQEIDQWDTVEDPLSSWESKQKKKNTSTVARRSAGEASHEKFVPQPQRSLGCSSRSRKSSSCVSQRQSRPVRSLSAAGNYAVNDTSNWSKYCSSIEPTAWKSEQNLIPDTLSYPCEASPGAFKSTDGKTFKDSVYTDCVTNTHYSDFLLLQQVNNSEEVPNGVKIIVGNTSAPITDRGSAVVQPAISPYLHQNGKSVFDKSSMTEHEENFTNFSETEFKELVRAFPAVPVSHLQEIFQKCNRDINWTVDVLLEMDYKGAEEASGVDTALKQCTPEGSDESGSDSPSAMTEKSDQQDTGHTSEEGWQSSESKTWQYEKENEKANGTPIQLSPNRSVKKDKNISPTAKELKEHIEQNIVLNENCYSEHTLRIRKMRHGELLDMGEVTTSSNKNNDTILQIEDCEEASTCHGVIGSSVKQNVLEASASGAELCPETGAADTVVEHSNQNSDIPATSSNAAAGISDTEAFVDIKLGEEFVSQLHELFGKSSYTTVCETSATVKLPVCLALQIHYYLMKHEEEQIKQKQDVMIKEDEELARKIQENYGRPTKDEKVPDLREIMDMEMALALYKADQSFCHRETKETLAIKLSKRILCEMFPTFRKEAILDVFSSTDNSFDNTLAVLIASTSEEEAKVAMSPEALREHRSQLIEAAEETVKRGVETTSPLEDFDDITADGRGSNVLYIVERYREQAAHHYRRRSEYHTKAQEAFQKGMPSVAHYYSQLARLHKTHAREASCRAATAIGAAAPDSAELDLHGLYVREAVCLLDSFLDAHIMRLKASGQARRALHVVTGRGVNSRGGQPRLRPAVLQRLTQRSIKYEEVNEGLFRLVLTRNNDVSK